EDIVSATTEPYISEIKLFPNPNYGVLYIEHMVNQVDNIEIRDLTGRKIFEEKLEKGSHKSSVDISVLPKGIYLVRISNNKVILKQKKLIKI
ncbi:MAG: T9SS type A sorting domain-containing protein, partial [Bacteroidota bacterium]|nr:T9SS type A sorting domain-containing protein [Bacteroidota bacterium]